MRRTLLAVVIVAALFAGACADDGADPAAEAADDSSETPTTDAAEVSEGEPEVAIDPAHASLLEALGPMTLTTPESGGGDRPILAWEPVAGAARYSVVVLDPDGHPYWGWRTEDTEIRVGVGDRADAVPGPRVAEGMTWSVVALDASGIPVAASARRPVGP